MAVLVDEYDSAVITDVTKHKWEAAKAGIAALSSLMMAAKAADRGMSNIAHFVVTGVSRFVHQALFSGPNVFTEITSHPMVSNAVGFRRDEIMGTFGVELHRFAGNMGMGIEDAMTELARWYNGYCFDGCSTCYYPYCVLATLKTGQLCKTAMAGMASLAWLGLDALEVIRQLIAQEKNSPISLASIAAVDIASVQDQRVDCRQLMLQTGLLTLVPQSQQQQQADCDAAGSSSSAAASSSSAAASSSSAAASSGKQQQQHISQL